MTDTVAPFNVSVTSDPRTSDAADEDNSQLPRLDHLDLQVMDRDSDSRWLNAILRLADTPNSFTDIVTPQQAAPLERDHFIEVQHVVDIILDQPGDWRSIPVGHYVDLATFVSDSRGMFRVSRTLNQAKKRIPLAQYPTNPQIAAYLQFRIAGNATVQGSVQTLMRDMANRNSAWPNLTRLVGRRILDLFRW